MAIYLSGSNFQQHWYNRSEISYYFNEIYHLYTITINKNLCFCFQPKEKKKTSKSSEKPSTSKDKPKITVTPEEESTQKKLFTSVEERKKPRPKSSLHVMELDSMEEEPGEDDVNLLREDPEVKEKEEESKTVKEDESDV